MDGLSAFTPKSMSGEQVALLAGFGLAAAGGFGAWYWLSNVRSATQAAAALALALPNTGYLPPGIAPCPDARKPSLLGRAPEVFSLGPRSGRAASPRRQARSAKTL